MDISVTQFKQRCLELVRRVEASGTRVTIKRRGRVVARLEPATAADSAPVRRPWEQLRALGGELRGTPEESVLRDEDFEALR
jgi:antitoxin (DNA-binding transcriptional repressor) of toxin-antitoxin stability system